jgi:hypothetical protein
VPFWTGFDSAEEWLRRFYGSHPWVVYTRLL